MSSIGAPRRICLVDDDVFGRDALAVSLRDLGYEVKVAPGAAAGLDIVERSPVDAIVTDICMPGTSGSELIAQARGRWPTLPIIAISGLQLINGIGADQAARALGADALLTKPFRAADLAALLANIPVRQASDPHSQA